MTRNLRNVEARTSQSSGDITRFKKTLNKLLNPDRVQNGELHPLRTPRLYQISVSC